MEKDGIYYLILLFLYLVKSYLFLIFLIFKIRFFLIVLLLLLSDISMLIEIRKKKMHKYFILKRKRI